MDFLSKFAIVVIIIMVIIATSVHSFFSAVSAVLSSSKKHDNISPPFYLQIDGGLFLNDSLEFHVTPASDSFKWYHDISMGKIYNVAQTKVLSAFRHPTYSMWLFSLNNIDNDTDNIRWLRDGTRFKIIKMTKKSNEKVSELCAILKTFNGTHRIIFSEDDCKNNALNYVTFKRVET